MATMTEIKVQMTTINTLTPRGRFNGPSTFPVIGPLVRRPQPDHHVHTCDQAEAMPTCRTQQADWSGPLLMTLQHLLQSGKAWADWGNPISF